MFYSEDIIEQVRTENDIVDVIGDYVKLKKRAVHILDSVRFITKSLHHFQYHQISRCIIALDVVKVEMLYLF